MEPLNNVKCKKANVKSTQHKHLTSYITHLTFDMKLLLHQPSFLIKPIIPGNFINVSAGCKI